MGIVCCFNKDILYFKKGRLLFAATTFISFVAARFNHSLPHHTLTGIAVQRYPDSSCQKKNGD